FSRIGGTLAALARSGRRFGLVLFSDQAYEAMPPGTPAADLAPFVRYFTLPQQRAAGFAPAFPNNPWQSTFTGGTRISAGLDLAHRIALAGGRPATVVLVSDLEDEPGDLPRLASVRLAYRRAHVPGRIVVLAAAAVGAALLAADVRGWRSALSGGDAVYAATPSRASWQPHARVGNVAEALLGVGDDVRLRHALQLYVDASKLHLRLDNATA